MRISLILFGVVLAVAFANSQNVAFCYFESWTTGRTGNGKFNVADIDTTLCTHVSYSFVGLGADGSVRLLDSGALFQQFTNLKTRNPKLKTLVSMGGWNEGSTTYSSVVANPSTRQNMVNSVYNFLKANNFDGFDLDWEYPGLRGGGSADKVNYITFLKELRQKFTGTGYLITAAVGATKSYFDSSYDVPNMSLYLDFINIMTYDLHGSYDGVTGQNAPLFASSIDTNQQLNVDACVKAWISAGADSRKILLGLGFYGRSFTLANPSNTQVGAPTSGPGTAGPYSQESGMLTYLEICEKLRTGAWTVVWDSKQQNPYAYSVNQWVGYDNIDSIKLKTQYAVDNKLGGVMLWAVDSDDHNNVCGQGAYPLLNAVNTVFKLNGSPNPPPPTNPPQTQPPPTNPPQTQPPPTNPPQTQPPPTNPPQTKPPPTNPPQTQPPQTKPPPTQPPQSGNSCTAPGYIRDSRNCSVYYRCVPNGVGGFTQYPFKCDGELVFDLVIETCNYKWASTVSGC